MKTTSVSRFAMSLAVLGLIFFARPTSVLAQAHHSKQVSQLLVKAKDLAIQAQHDSDTLTMFINSNVSMASHRHQINIIKEHVNNMGKVAGQLRDAQPQASKWQQDAIQQIFPLVQAMADHLTTVINYVVKNPNESTVEMVEYRRLVRENHKLAETTANLIRDHVAYDKARVNFDALAGKLNEGKK